MAFAFNPTAYLITLAAPLLLIGAMAALLSRRWQAAGVWGILAVLTLAIVEYGFLVAPSRVGVEAWPYFWHACTTLLVSVTASVLAILLVRRRSIHRAV